MAALLPKPPRCCQAKTPEPIFVPSAILDSPSKPRVTGPAAYNYSIYRVYFRADDDILNLAPFELSHG